MTIDDLWLYQYHKVKYNGIIKNVFQTISFIEEKQWEVVGLGGVIDGIEETIEEIPKYNPDSNIAYMEESRNNNLLIDTTLDFFIFYTPLILVIVFLWNRIFYLLFNYEMSKFLRPYSFWLIIVDILIQNNIEFFVFLGYRSLEVMH